MQVFVPTPWHCRDTHIPAPFQVCCELLGKPGLASAPSSLPFLSLVSRTRNLGEGASEQCLPASFDQLGQDWSGPGHTGPAGKVAAVLGQDWSGPPPVD